MSRVSVQKNPKVQGDVAHDAADSGSPVKFGGKALTGDPAGVADNDRVDAFFDEYGKLGIFITANGAANQYATTPSVIDGGSISGRGLQTFTPVLVQGPDGAADIGRGAGDSGPGLGAQNVALIGGDITLRSSAIAGEASGTSTAVDNLGWVKRFNCHLDITAAPSGGSPTLDVYLQTQLASGDWQDIVHFTQASGVTAEIVDYGPPDGNFSGIGAEGSAMTYDRFFAEQDGALTAVNIRLMNLGDSMRVKWVFAAGGSSGDFTSAVTGTFHS